MVVHRVKLKKQWQKAALQNLSGKILGDDNIGLPYILSLCAYKQAHKILEEIINVARGF